jgi:hypothetical protein
MAGCALFPRNNATAASASLTNVYDVHVSDQQLLEKEAVLPLRQMSLTV